MRVSSRVQDKLQTLPDKPGVYLLRDRGGRVIYVGKASSLRKRVRWYFRQYTLRSADPKLRGLIKSVADLSFVVCRTEAEAALTEARLIKDFRPRYNVYFRDDKRFLMLKVNLRDPVPRFTTCRIRKEDEAEYFGPYPSAAVARTALDYVQKRFGLRRCRSRLPDEEDRKHCLYETMRYCSAPCIGRITLSEYRARVEAACRFLRGEDPGSIEELRAAMEEAAAKREYEKAARLRDLWLRLEEAVRTRRSHVRRLKFDREEGARGVEELCRQFRLPRVPEVIEAFDVSHISGSMAVGSLVSAVWGVPRPERYRRYRIQSEVASDDTAMLAEVIRRRYTRLTKEGRPLPDLVLVDGGLPQANTARRVLDELGLSHIPVLGLAKKMEEIYLPGVSQPQRLAEDSAALHTIQWLRDEAHRFAIGYHREVRARRIRESVLDDIEGIGPKRRRLLLEHFGDIGALARASLDDICRVPGFGRRMAEYLKRELAQRLGERAQKLAITKQEAAPDAEGSAHG